jgi:protein SCO1
VTDIEPGTAPAAGSAVRKFFAIRRGVYLAAAILFGIIVVLTVRWVMQSEPKPSVAAIGGPFSLVDQDGKRVTDRDFRGKLMLVYFGYAHCPDICPLVLQELGAALDRLGPAAAVQPVFISVDAERDTPENLKAFVANIHPKLIALTGTPAEIKAAASAYRAYYANAAPTAEGPRDLIDHTGIVYVMGRDGNYLANFGPTSSAGEIADRLRKYL